MSLIGDGNKYTMQKTIHFIVSGRVQGVFFRAACKQQADHHQIQGWVRNLPDGRVEGMATADAASLQHLCDWLGRGPQFASVQTVEITDQPLEQFDTFEVRYGTGLA
jgi:acylphosphatase